ncbi:efflux RND transporter permease subunit [Radicibacter daui]|uniref:efflux RND transporter permease subunit n=1 Tax=Radicibacter daui TaxID=3064829 RepID=UPI004046A905
MSFTELFIRRPVLSTVISLLILLLGAQSILGIDIRQYPKIDETVITVQTTYAGASASLMQGFITTPIAKAVASAEGVDYVTSSSTQGVSTVSVHMRLNTNPDSALTEVIAKTQQVRQELPDDADDPIVQKGNGQSFALMYLAFSSDRMSPQQVNEYLVRVIQPRLATISGVADPQILGGKTFSMRVWIDPLKLAARGVTATDLVAAIRGSNFLAAPGNTKNSLVAYAVETATTLQTPETFGALPVLTRGAEVVRLRDVATVELAPENDDVKVSFNGTEGTFIGITTTPSANPLDTAKLVRDELPSLQQSLPEGMQVKLVYDSTKFITASIEEVFRTIGEAAAIVIVVILLFLGSFRSVLIPIVTIPLSLIGVCFFLYALGYSLNTLTLLAMVLAIGLVVDDAIVVVENIHRHIEEGLKPVDAAIRGMHEITGPVIAMTITLAAVYAPIGFTQGLTGSLFREFAFTLAGAVIISGVIALTLSPMMSSKLLKAHGEHGGSWFQRFVDRRFDWLAGWYGRRLVGSLNMRFLTLLIVVCLLATTGFLFKKTSQELAPEEDQGAVFALVNAPPYATTDYTKQYIDAMDSITKSIPEIESSFAIAGSDGNGGFAGWTFKPWAERNRPQKAIQQQIQAGLDANPGVKAFAFAIPSLPGTGGGLPIQYVVQSIGSADRVFEVSEEIRQKAQASGKFIVVQNSATYSTPQAKVLINRDRAATLGVPISDIGTTLNVMLGGGSMSKFDRDNRSYDVITQALRPDRFNPEDMNKYYVRSESGTMVPLSALVTVHIQPSPAAIEQFNQLNSATLSALPLPGVTNVEGLETLRQIGKEVMPTGFFEDFGGESRLSIQEGNSLLTAFGLAVIVIFLVLSAQFESFRDPFIIMMSVPLSIFGAMVPLNIGLATLNIYTQVGLITLVGLITKHGILMVEFANQLRHDQGYSKRDAIIHAAQVRLRPILMTTAAMVLGTAPLLWASGAGAAARFSIGIVITSGMAVGTMFTLFVVPMFYTFISRPDPRPATSAEGQGGGHGPHTRQQRAEPQFN